MSNQIKIFQLNAGGWITNKLSIQNAIRKENIDVVLINEHGIKAGEELKITSYNVYKKNALNERRSGCAIAIRKNLEYRIREDFHSDLLSIEIDTSLGPIIIATAYIPPRVGYLHYPDYFRLFNTRKPVYFVGDLNARDSILGHRNSNKTGKALATLIKNQNANYIGPDFPTFINNRSCTSPDIILTNNHTYHNSYSEPGPPNSSDHIPIILTISSKPILIPIRKRNSYKNANWEGYRYELEQANRVDRLENVGDIEDAVGRWTRDIQQASDRFIPKVSYRAIPHPKTSPQIRQLETEYTRLRDNIYRLGPTVGRTKRIRELRTEIRQEYRRINRESWNEFVGKIDKERNKEDFWKSIKRIYGQKETREVKYLKDNDGNDIFKEDKREKIFRGYWERIFQISEEENESFDEEINRTVKRTLSENSENITTKANLNEENIITEIITAKEIKETIKSFKQKAPGNDGITKNHLMNLPQSKIIDLAKIFSTSLTLGHFPTIWKQSTMIFLPKPFKSPTNHINYRPISLLNLPAKILEKIINKRLIESIDQKNLNNQSQHGFRKDFGTDTATAIIYETIAAVKSNNFKTNVILRDISKAFDKVWHEGLIFKFLINNFHPNLTRIISSYLHNRKACIRIGNYIGPNFNLKCGVPQGGCLSPTLFNFYTHDIPQPESIFNNHIIYADDITQIISYKSEKMLKRITEREIRKVNDYERKWKINTNMNKFQIIPIGGKRKQKIEINNKPIEYSESGKSLGMIISKTGFTAHAKNRISIAKASIPKLHSLIDLSPANKRLLYLTMIRSKLLYPTIPLHTRSTNLIQKLQIVQNKCARIITKTRLIENKTNKITNKEAKLPAINEVLHNSAKSIWNKLNIDNNQELKITVIEHGERNLFKSSRKICMTDITPKF